MGFRKVCLAGLTFVACILAANWAWAIGFELGETKEELKLKYEVKATDHKTGRVTVTLTLEDEGRLGPLDSIDLQIADAAGPGYVDLSISLAVRKVDGKQVVTAHLLRSLAERGSLQLKTHSLDGKKEGRTWYYHAIPLAPQLPPASPGK